MVPYAPIVLFMTSAKYVRFYISLILMVQRIPQKTKTIFIKQSILVQWAGFAKEETRKQVGKGTSIRKAPDWAKKPSDKVGRPSEGTRGMRIIV